MCTRRDKSAHDNTSVQNPLLPTDRAREIAFCSKIQMWSVIFKCVLLSQRRWGNKLNCECSILRSAYDTISKLQWAEQMVPIVSWRGCRWWFLCMKFKNERHTRHATDVAALLTSKCSIWGVHLELWSDERKISYSSVYKGAVSTTNLSSLRSKHLNNQICCLCCDFDCIWWDTVNIFIHVHDALDQTQWKSKWVLKFWGAWRFLSIHSWLKTKVKVSQRLCVFWSPHNLMMSRYLSHYVPGRAMI